MENLLSKITLKAALLDCITYMKFKQHLSPTWKIAKNQICNLVGQKTNISNKEYFIVLYIIYKDNNLENEFNEVCKKFNVTI